MQIERVERAVAVDASTEGQHHRVAGARAGELLLARVLETHRATGGDGEMRTEVFDQHLLLAAKAAADARLDHTDALDRQPN